MCGYAFAHGINLAGFGQFNEVNFTVVGMAAVLSGTIHIPLTAIFLIAEITGGYALFVPLMLVSSLSFLGSRSLQPYSIYNKPDPAIPDRAARH
jgi:CIC family chloride channel protein